jgi:hypothetical protein
MGGSGTTNITGANLQMSHVAIWSAALNDADMATVQGGTQVDYRTTRGSHLEHYWPMQGDLSDVGYGPGKPLVCFGGNCTWKGSAL